MERWIYKAALRIRSLVRSTRVEAELDEELRFHLDRQVAEDVAHGVAPDVARRAAALALGGVDQQKEACRDLRRSVWVDHAFRDLRYGARALRRNPGFAFVALLSLALGIGANTAIFQLIDAVQLRPLPVPRPEQLAEVTIAGGHGGFGISDDQNSHLTYPIWEQIRDRQRAFSGVFAWGTTPFLIGTGQNARQVSGLWVSGEAFSVLGVTASAGRLFGPGDDRRGCTPSVVLNDAFWRAQFGGDPSAIGQTLTILDRPVRIIGVTQPEFFGFDVGRRFDIALPTCAAAAWGSQLDRRDWFWLSILGRLRDGWTVARAAEHLHAMSASIMDATRPVNRQAASIDQYLRFRLTAASAATGVSQLRTVYGDALWLLLAMTGVVLLVACTNLMNLLLARATARESEIAVRVALGASRARVVAQLVVESLLLAVCGTVAGILLARPLSAGLVALMTTSSNAIELPLQTNRHVLAFAASAAAATCVLFGLIPALRASQLAPGSAARLGGRGLTAGRDRLFIQRSLVAAQVALSVVLVFAAALFVRSFRNLITLDTGFTREGVLFARLADFSERPSPAGILAAERELLDRIRSLPQIQSAASTTKMPLDGSSWTQSLVLPGVASADRRSAKFTYVSPQYFRTVGMRITNGRDIDDGDTQLGRRVVLVNETFVRRYLASRPAIGAVLKTIPEPGYPETLYEVVGVVTDAKYSALREPTPPATFVPLAQHPNLRPWPGIVIRSAVPPEQAIGALRRAVADVRPRMAVGVSVFETQVADSLMRERSLAWLAGGFGATAALLAIVGVYGVLAYLVRRRRQEIAIRLALGARPANVVVLVLREMLTLLAIGVAAGGLSAAALGGASSFLFGVSPRDPATLLAVIGALAIVAVIAALVPAVRASRIDATAALRAE